MMQHFTEPLQWGLCVLSTGEIICGGNKSETGNSAEEIWEPKPSEQESRKPGNLHTGNRNKQVLK